MGVHIQFGSDEEDQAFSPTQSKNNDVVRSKSNVMSIPTNSPPKRAEATTKRQSSKRGQTSQKPVGAQIRALERLLKNKAHTLPVAARKQKEQQLTELRRLVGEKTRRKVEGSIAKKYHMVRFFERRKLERALSALELEKEVGPKAQAKKAQVMKDLNYVRNFPKGRKYVALFPKGGHTKKSRAEVEAIHAEVERFLKGSLIADKTAPNDTQQCGCTSKENDEVHVDGCSIKGDDGNNCDQTDDFFLEDDAE